MFPRGIIYQKGISPKKGEIGLHPTFLVRLGYLALRGVGAGLIGAVTIALIFTYAPIIKEEISFVLLGPKKIASRVSWEPLKADPGSLVREEAGRFGVGAYFSIVIPGIGAASDVVANVSTSDPKEYLAALEEGVAHARGTYFPGQGETVFLFAHSTDSPINIARYNAVFYLLRKLEPGDTIIVFFADKKYTYEVTEKLVTSASDTSWLATTGEERLILQTCDPPGTTFRRLLVIAEPLK